MDNNSNGPFQELEKKRSEERMRQKLWEQKHRLGSFRRKAKINARSSSEDNLSAGQYDDQEPGHDILQLAVESPPQTLSPSYSRRQSISGQSGRRPSIAGQGYQTPVNRHDRYRRRRSVSPMDPRDTLFRRSSPSRIDDDMDPYLAGAAYDDRAQSPTLFGVDNDLLDISPVPISRRQSVDRHRSPRLSLATSPREHLSFFAESDPMPYLRQMSHQYSQERRLSQTFPEGRSLALHLERDREQRADTDSVTSDDRSGQPSDRF